MVEPSEPGVFHWDDNFLCVPQDSPLLLEWSYTGIPDLTGELASFECEQVNEPSEPGVFHWDDNFLCFAADSDGDGLLDGWETAGLDVDNDGVIDLDLPNIAGPGVGANPNHKDLFLELDWRTGFQPNQANVQAMKTAFALAPKDAGGVMNPDDLLGIRLWVDTGTLLDPMGIEGGVGGPASCGDGFDNDGNGLTDADDPSCLVGDDLTREQGAPAGSCRNAVDDDADGLIDGADPDCLRGGNLLFDPTGNELGGARDMTCSNGIDDDGNGLTDGNDGNCQFGGNVDFAGIFYILKNGTEMLPVEDGMGPNSCFDGVDNGGGDEDGDGNAEIDGADPDCRTTCFNGIDDDGDTATDSDDLSCQIGGNFDRRTRALVFRYGIMAEGGGGTGWAPGKEFVTRNAGDGGTLMHEFGHNLGLKHGGTDGANRKPNYISVMDYDEQFCIFQRGSTSGCDDPTNVSRPLIDYSPARWGGAEGASTAFNVCYDGLDNDGDGLIDAGDPECQEGIGRAGAPLANLNETLLTEAEVVDPGNRGHSIIFHDQTGIMRIWNADTDLDGDGMPDGIDWAGDGFPYDGSNLTLPVDVNRDSICVCSGADGTLETVVLGGEDVPFPAGLPGCQGPTIRNGGNQTCETTAAATDNQVRTEFRAGAGSCTDGTDNDGDGNTDGADPDCFEPNPLNGSDDWTAIRMGLRGLGDRERGTNVGQMIDDREQTIEVFQQQLRILNTSDLSVHLSAIPDPVEIGGELTYNITATTGGPNPASQVRVHDVLSPNVTLVGDTGNCTQGAGNELTCDIGELLLQETKEFSITVQTGACDAGAPLAITNTVMVENLSGPDPDAANNQAVVTVFPVDTTAPTISFNAPSMITPPDAPISFTATAVDICDSDVTPMITSFDCFAFTPNGRRIDKTESCQVSLSGDTITIIDSGGVGTHIAWTARAVDRSSNALEEEFELQVAHPRNR